MRCRIIYWSGERMTQGQRFAAMTEGKFFPDPDVYDVVTAVSIPEIRTLQADRLDVANHLFEQFNIGDRGGRDDIRSMSVGDIVAFPDGVLLVCQPVGWKGYINPEFSTALKMLDDTRFLKRLQVKIADGSWRCQT